MVDGSYFLAYDPSFGDETALAATVHMAVSRAIVELAAGSGGGINVDAARQELVQLRRLLEDFDAVEAAHGSAIKAIQKASGAASGTRAAILTVVGRLDTLLLT